ncbi:hypothetical protein EON65_12335 [archaeon]|nr:MAG: hypothetical protein EON65_12335 [archaeon]
MMTIGTYLSKLMIFNLRLRSIGEKRIRVRRDLVAILSQKGPRPHPPPLLAFFYSYSETEITGYLQNLRKA